MLCPTRQLYSGQAMFGSVRQLTDAAGMVQRVQSYTPFGEALGGAGSATTSFGYTGEWEDASGLLYLRARYYDGMAGRFTQRDPWQGDAQRPQSLNAYGYVGNNPVLLTDPSGQCYGPLSFLRQVPIESQNCVYLDQSLFILGTSSAYADDNAKRMAGAYVGGWTIGHSYLLVGAGILTANGIASVPTSVEAVNAWGLRYLVPTTTTLGIVANPPMGQAPTTGQVAGACVDTAKVILGIGSSAWGAEQIQTRTRTQENQDIVYRNPSLFYNEHPAALTEGFKPHAPDSLRGVVAHVATGSTYPSRFISLTRSLDKAIIEKKPNLPIYVINLKEVQGQVIDLTIPSVLDQYIRYPRTKNSAIASQEVLVDGWIPPVAIKGLMNDVNKKMMDLSESNY